jgi:hypothetical protein
MDPTILADYSALLQTIATMSNQTDSTFNTIQSLMDKTKDPNLVFSHEEALCHSKTILSLKSYLNKQPRGPLKAKFSAQIAIILRRLKPFINV